MYKEIASGILISEDTKKPKVSIYDHAVLMLEESIKAGHRIYKDVPYIIVKYEGADAVSEPLTDEHKQAHPDAWYRYLNNKTELGGTAISALPGVTKSVEFELAGLGIKTVEKLSDTEVPENLAKYKNMAKKYLELMKEAEDESRVA